MPPPGTTGPDRPMRADARRNRTRILEAAELVFAEQGSSGSTEEVARRAGVAIGTVFRHFPTKDDLLAAIMKNLLEQLVAEAGALSDSEPRTALFTFFTRIVEQAAARKAVVDLLARNGVEIRLPELVTVFADAVGDMLRQAQTTGTVDPDIRLPEVMALLASTSQGALHGGWDRELRRRVLDVVFAGLAPKADRPTDRAR
ncbi:TetR/AcrR family transcriptional regulator [Plantactinospora sonchi]|uniref:TetR/AcrR family transcriptional regulator n=1 Tax=Plantactinospora sonchi TaxID=1544735 RepID=A0ABU7RS00_9ACTN